MSSSKTLFIYFACLINVFYGNAYIIGFISFHFRLTFLTSPWIGFKIQLITYHTTATKKNRNGNILTCLAKFHLIESLSIPIVELGFWPNDFFSAGASAIMGFNWEKFLKKHRDEIVLEWRNRLKNDVSEHYAQRSPEELSMTTIRAFDSFYQVLAHKNYALINDFINEITKIRLEAGFRLDDVQKAFEIYRQILIPILVKESPVILLCENIEAVNTNLAYTIHRFSNHFQKMHDKYINEYAKQLEKDVAERTSELRKSEDKYKTLVEDISDGYLALYGEKIAFANPAFCRMHGYQAEEILHKSILSFVSKEHHENVSAIIDREGRKGIEPEAFEYLRLTKKKQCLPTEINFKGIPMFPVINKLLLFLILFLAFSNPFISRLKLS